MIFISAVNSNLHLPFQFHIFQSHCLTHDSDLSEKHELFPPTTRQLDTSALNGTDTSTANCQPPERINQPSAENGIIRNGKYAHCIDRIFVLFAMCVCVYIVYHMCISQAHICITCSRVACLVRKKCLLRCLFSLVYYWPRQTAQLLEPGEHCTSQLYAYKSGRRSGQVMQP